MCSGRQHLERWWPVTRALTASGPRILRALLYGFEHVWRRGHRTAGPVAAGYSVAGVVRACSLNGHELDLGGGVIGFGFALVFQRSDRSRCDRMEPLNTAA